MITVRLPKEMEHALDRLARAEHRTRSEIVKQALQGYLALHESRQTPYELGIDLFGAGDAPERDLSTNYKSKLKEKLRAKHAH